VDRAGRAEIVTDVSKSPQRIAGMFDAIAGRYDFLNHLLSAGIDVRWRTRAIASLGLTGRERVLDLCTGTADLAIAAVRGRPHGAARVVGVDFAGAMLGVAHDKVRRGRLADRIALVRGDAMRIPAADRSVDAITIAFGIRNVERIEIACAEMRRVLKPAGRLAILEFAVPTTPGVSQLYLWYCRNVLPRIGRAVSRHSAAYDYLPASIDAFAAPAEFVKVLRQAGFGDVRADPLTFGSVILYTASRGSGTGD
jgi:demethylmenaquinone methyltransferase / 2-methoxy-6-polyprenyl-1,4-benzoquinol methylase